MKICAAQTKPVKGNIQKNIEKHKRLIDLAISHGADTIIFPELSITGYEPELATELATDAYDVRFDDFQKISDTKQVMIGVGVPTKNHEGICISMILFLPNKPRQTYSKKYLHEDELPFFVHGENKSAFLGKTNIALAICYELSVPQHAQDAFKSGATIYIASAVKTQSGVDKAIQRLSEIARDYSMTVLLSNCIGLSGGYDCDGRSSVWNKKGVLLGQLGETNEGILIIDTETQQVIKKTVLDIVQQN
ncbi:MAG TPA: carbon-nitrogen hydrolase family protein [Flavitalea sp.]|nr:carbon-nitrogen hydrolase family protein [Flavitalea sp.]